jgi:hypothetical protein
MEHRARFQVRYLFIGVLVLFLTGVWSSTPAVFSVEAQLNPDNCTLTPDLLDGNGSSVGGAGASVSGSGASVSGSGASVSGSGASVSGSGASVSGSGASVSGSQQEIEALIASVIANEVDFINEVNFVTDIENAITHNPDTPVAIIIVDNQNHGDFVQDVIEQFDDAIPGNTNLTIERVLIGENDDYSLANAVAGLTAKINELEPGIQNFVIDLSFVIFPCADEVTYIDNDGNEQTYDFNFNAAVESIENDNTFEAVIPYLDCVIDNYDGTLTAHFSYFNPNSYPVTIPYNTDEEEGLFNFLSGGNLAQEQLEIATPQFFGVPNGGESPGFSQTYPNSAFQITWDAYLYEGYEPLEWTLIGETITVGYDAPLCDDDEEEEYYEEEDDVHISVNNILECVTQLGPDTYVAHFGFENESTLTGSSDIVPVTLEIGTETRLSGGGLSGHERAVITPFYFGVPEVISGRPGRSDFYPNSAFQVIFDGTDLVWTVEGSGTATANANSTPCLTDLGTGIGDFIKEDGGLTDNEVEQVIAKLVEEGGNSEDADVDAFQQLLRNLNRRSLNEPNFNAVAVASAGNYRQDFIAIGAGPGPSAPGKWESTIAVAGSFGGTPQQWENSQDGEVMVPAGGYKLSGTNNNYLLGTSFSVPIVVRTMVAYLRIPGSCTYVEIGGIVRPPVLNPGIYDNDPVVAGQPTPFNCVLEPVLEEEPEILGFELWDPHTDTKIRDLNHPTDTINLAETPRVTVVAVANGEATESVKFFLDGRSHRLENFVPYAFEGDRNGDLRRWNARAGHTYVIGARPYSEDGASGNSGDLKEITLTVVDNPDVTNEPPQVNAGPHRTITLGDSAILDGHVSDPTPTGTLNILWSKQSGPGDVAFGDDTNPDTTATFTEAGTYVLQLEATDGEFTSSDTVQVTVEEPGSGGPAVVGYQVWDTSSDSFVDGDFTGDITLNLADDPTIVAVVEGAVDKVVFKIDNRTVRTERVVPYVISGDRPNTGDVFNWNMTPGTYTVKITPVKDNVEGTSLEFEVTIVDNP